MIGIIPMLEEADKTLRRGQYLPLLGTLLYATDIIESMVKNGMPFEAVEVASIFGLEDKFSSKTMLTPFLQESTKAFERAKREANKSHVALKKANEKQLDALKSIVHYSENRSIDATELLGSWQIKEKIVTLEEEIVELKKRIEEKKMKKRKRNEKGSSSTVKSQEVKRSRLATEGSPLPKSEANQLCEQPTTILSEGNALVPISSNANNSPVTSAAPHGSTNSFPKTEMDQIGGTTNVRSGSISGNGLPYRWQQGYVAQSTSKWFADLFGSSPSMEGFVGLPDRTIRTLADLYRFADSL
ncbi:hypothetical protein Goari_015727, partial [Gossypium aridum]|nr:hypothetical protein [Gossypium aridum]